MITVNSLIGVSDLHVGCQMGLCPEVAHLDGGGIYQPSVPFQAQLLAWWHEFWHDWVPMATEGDAYGVVVNGDIMDGRHHKSTTQWTQNLADQQRAAYELLAPVAELCEGRLWIIRGTEAHTGPNAENEEKLAERLAAIQDDAGNYSRPELWKYVGPEENILTHWSHHIGCTGAAAYETTAVHREFINACIAAGRWGLRAPDFVIRGHRHAFVKTEVATGNMRGVGLVLPGWQGKTPWVWRLEGGRMGQPQFGGAMIRYSSQGEPYSRQQVWTLDRPEVE